MKKLLAILLLMTAIVGLAQTQEQQKFALELFNKIAEENKGDNIAFSPFSAQVALFMQMNGANGNTLEEMKRATHTEAFSMDEINTYYKTLLGSLEEEENCYAEDGAQETKINIANGLWANVSVPFKQEFIASCTSFYNADVESIVFDTNGMNNIDGWLSNKTDGLIPSADINLNPNTLLVLVNSLLFKSGWQVGLGQELLPLDKTFHNNDGTSGIVPSLVFDNAIIYKAEDYQAGILALGTSDRYTFTAYLPNDNNADFALTDNIWQKTVEGKKDKATVQIPCFNVETGYDLKPSLINMGIIAAFEKNGDADFSNMSTQNSYIDIFKQINTFSVDENGTMAASGTIVVDVPISSGPASEEFIIDRPFYFTIEDNINGTILYAGHITNLGTTNAIEDVTVKTTSTPISYDLQGRRVGQKSMKSIFISNGKKVLK